MTECSVCGDDADDVHQGYRSMSRSVDADGLDRVCVKFGGPSVYVYLHEE